MLIKAAAPEATYVLDFLTKTLLKFQEVLTGSIHRTKDFSQNHCCLLLCQAHLPDLIAHVSWSWHQGAANLHWTHSSRPSRKAAAMACGRLTTSSFFMALLR